jgi:hypothetical protein
VFQSRKIVPPARSEDLLVELVGEETVIYDLTSKEAHCLKPLAGLVFAAADGRATHDELAERATKELGHPVSGAEVGEAIEQLTDRSLLDVPLAIRDGLSRRQVMRRTAFAGAAAFAAPLITSIVAPTAAMAASGIPTGCTGCGKNSDCLSNHCCQSNAGKQCRQSCCVGANNSCHTTNCVGTVCDCTVEVAAPGCNDIVCPSGSTKCCTSVTP